MHLLYAEQVQPQGKSTFLTEELQEKKITFRARSASLALDEVKGIRGRMVIPSACTSLVMREGKETSRILNLPDPCPHVQRCWFSLLRGEDERGAVLAWLRERL